MTLKGTIGSFGMRNFRYGYSGKIIRVLSVYRLFGLIIERNIAQCQYGKMFVLKGENSVNDAELISDYLEAP